MRRRPKFPAFSLVEVVIAVGIFAVAVTGILGLLPGLLWQNAEATDRAIALRLPASLEVELVRLVRSGGFDALAASVPVMGSTLENGLAFVATHDGGTLVEASSATGVMVDTEQYFLLEAWRFADTPLAYDANTGVMLVHVRVTWPYRLPGLTTATALQSRSEVSWSAAINR